MLTERDLELIGGVVRKAIEPVREEVKELRKDVTELQVEVKELRKDVTELQVGMRELRKDVTELQVGMTELRKDVTELQVGMTELRKDVTELQTGMEKLRTDVDSLSRKTDRIECMMENELRPNICKIAEGHLDLSRKLDMVRVRRSEYTLLDIKVSGLQLDIREIRDKLKIA